MNNKDLNEFKKILNEKKDILLKSVDHKKQKDLQEPVVGDEIDAAGDSEEKELIFGLTDNERVMLDSIESALHKIEHNKYGICERCTCKIPIERLKAMPYARYCIKCQPKFEPKK